MKVIALSAAHVESAAEVVAELHMSGSGPVSSLADREAARLAVDSVIGSGPGVVAVDESAVVGFMVAPLPPVPGQTAVRLWPAHHAVRPDHARPAYRRMYEAIAEKLVAVGCTYHSLPVPAGVPSALDTFFELGFGVDQIKGAVAIGDREVPSSAGDDGRDVRDVRVATPKDIDELVQLAIELTKFHSRTPMFQPALLDVPRIRESLIWAIEDDAATVLVIDDGERPVAMMSAQPDNAYARSVVIGMNIVAESVRSEGMGTAMLDVLLRWAADRAYEYCTVGWASSNLISDAFYRSHGFTPIRHRLHRRIDPHVTWANDDLDYSIFQSQ
ncbi:GNAT family N-acetyltransferase [Actinopolymorpha alba]|uniref:GNAT family N-acetyltransferase n=1 Tax=Actinopolymorpha alba TaxID=533267 RepID=UPI00036817C7|nr:GNAT family N-acetyltransferase [Actinopolymorpha alba]